MHCRTYSALCILHLECRYPKGSAVPKIGVSTPTGFHILAQGCDGLWFSSLPWVNRSKIHTTLKAVASSSGIRLDTLGDVVIPQELRWVT